MLGKQFNWSLSGIPNNVPYVHTEALNLPGWRLHPLKGDFNGYWSITVNGNWRIIFCFDGADVTDVDLIDYH